MKKSILFSVIFLSLLAFISARAPAGSAQDGTPYNVLLIALQGEFPSGAGPGIQVAEIDEIKFRPADKAILMSFSGGPAINPDCFYTANDFFGYGAGGDWGAYSVDFVAYSTMARNYIKQELDAWGIHAPSCE